MAIDNQIFHHFRMKEEEIQKAKNLLRRHGYTVKNLNNSVYETNRKVYSDTTSKGRN